MRIHHIGYLVRDIGKSAEVFRMLGFNECSEITHDEWRGVDIMFLENASSKVELVAPFSKESDVYSLRSKIGNAPYHICYEVDDMDAAIERLLNERFAVISEPHEAPAINDKRAAFLMNGKIGLIELVEV